jgi:protein involved in polysaccharide export with SLBB domain
MRVILATIALIFGLAAGMVQTAFADETSKPANVASDYRLGSGDKLRIITFGEADFSGEFFVGGSGKVSLPLIGELPATGLTAGEFQRTVETALMQGYLKQPRVSVEVLTYRPFYILGEVNKPGEYPYTNGLTVMNAVATSEGFTYRANTKKVFIRHADSTDEQEYKLGEPITVMPGDTIRVVERFF